VAVSSVLRPYRQTELNFLQRYFGTIDLEGTQEVLVNYPKAVEQTSLEMTEKKNTEL
jgi:hypothetical protein